VRRAARRRLRCVNRGQPLGTTRLLPLDR
jgi:hypothetical protein